MTSLGPIPHNRWWNRPQYEAAALRVLRSGHVAQGPEVEAFEAELAERYRPGGAACCVSSGTAALMVALRELAEWWEEGDQFGRPLRLPTYACAALRCAASAVGFGMPYCDRGERVEWLDCEADTLNTPAATVVVHTYGVIAPIGPRQVEDFTHAAGAFGVGSAGAFSVISFGATKPLGVGVGGAVLGPVNAIDKIRRRRDYDTTMDEYAFNLQMGDVAAAIGRARLLDLCSDNVLRRAIARHYSSSLPRWIDRQAEREVPYRYLVRLPIGVVAEAMRRLAEAGVYAIRPVRPDELLHRVQEVDDGFPNALKAAQEAVSLPIWPGMDADAVERVCASLRTLEDLG